MSDERIAMVDANPYDKLEDFGPVSEELRDFAEKFNLWHYTGTIADLINDMRKFVRYRSEEYDDDLKHDHSDREYHRDWSQPNYRLFHRIQKAPGFSRELFEKYFSFQASIGDALSEEDHVRDELGPTSRYQDWEERRDYCEWNLHSTHKQGSGKGWHGEATTWNLPRQPKPLVYDLWGH